jgi:predicted dehydrogenase
MRENRNRTPDRVVLAGGGRWARILLLELTKLLPAGVPVEIVSPSASDVMRQWLRDAKNLGDRKMIVRADFPDTVEPSAFALAVVANRPADHFASAIGLIERGYHVFVEKPLTTDPIEACRLVERGAQLKRAVMAGLAQLFAPYIAAFRSRLPFAAGDLVGVDIDWGDPARELRYGEFKQADSRTGIAFDLVPHAWSLLRAFKPMSHDIKMELTAVASDGDEINLKAATAQCSCSIRLSRSASDRRRYLVLRTTSQRAAFDFSNPPFTATIDGQSCFTLPERTEADGGAVAHELRYFVQLADNVSRGQEPPEHPAVGRFAIEHVELASSIDRAIAARRAVS